MFKGSRLFILTLFLMLILPAFALCAHAGESNHTPLTQERVLYSFPGRTFPGTALTVYSGNLYGTTQGGGADGQHGYGTLYEYNLTTGKQSVLYSFQGGAADGSFPRAGLTVYSGNLYGTTGTGGPYGKYGNGTLFEYNFTTGKLSVLHFFQGGTTDGSAPEAALTVYSGNLYGTTYGGGTDGDGTLFEYNPATGKQSVLYSFKDDTTSGSGPQAALTVYDGNLYGTTSQSAFGYGTLFEYNLTTGKQSVLHTFIRPANGITPQGALIVYNGNLYGTTRAGGVSSGGTSSGGGTLFEYNLKAGKESVLYRFGKGGITDGSVPYAGLTLCSGSLYGTTYMGGAHGWGTLFKYNPATGKESVVYSFKGAPADGSAPQAGLVVYNGKLYGTTVAGGAKGGAFEGGTIFELY